MSRVQRARFNGRMYVDMVDLENFLRAVERKNPGITTKDYIDHVIREVFEGEFNRG